MGDPNGLLMWTSFNSQCAQIIGSFAHALRDRLEDSVVSCHHCQHKWHWSAWTSLGVC